MFQDTSTSLANAWDLLLSIIYNVRETVKEGTKWHKWQIWENWNPKSLDNRTPRWVKTYIWHTDVKHTSAHASSWKHQFLGLWHLDYFTGLLCCWLYVQECLEYSQVEPCDITNIWQILTYTIVSSILHILDKVKNTLALSG